MGSVLVVVGDVAGDETFELSLVPVKGSRPISTMSSHAPFDRCLIVALHETSPTHDVGQVRWIDVGWHQNDETPGRPKSGSDLGFRRVRPLGLEPRTCRLRATFSVQEIRCGSVSRG